MIDHARQSSQPASQQPAGFLSEEVTLLVNFPKLRHLDNHQFYYQSREMLLTKRGSFRQPIRLSFWGGKKIRIYTYQSPGKGKKVAIVKAGIVPHVYRKEHT